MEYQVLARKYRPRTLSELIGQDVLVQTLKNAIDQDRVPHAFVLTGIRGVGKTSTARIIAKCLNYRGVDGNAEMSSNPSDDCDQCKAIEESRHPDVIEMDAASRTGVGDIRELIESVQYAPTIGRFKIYIIDEVHMLSKSAFNALLKTLEEPPEHCKFIFATTEIRKIPVTILSRCMRFDLPRVDVDTLSAHFTNIAGKEGVEIDPQAAQLIAHAAEGSVRDGLSLLDQAIGNSGRGNPVSFTGVQNMLGISDRSQLFDLLEAVNKGEIEEALNQLRSLYQGGADPVMLLQDMLDIAHGLTVCKVQGGKLYYEHLSQPEQERYQSMSGNLSVPYLTRLWQMLLRGVSEAKVAPQPISAVEMILIRIAYSADMPPPGDLAKKLEGQGAAGGVGSSGGSGGNGGGVPQARLRSIAGGGQSIAMPKPLFAEAQEAEFAAVAASLESLEGLVEKCKEHDEMILAAHLQDVGVVVFDAEAGRFEFNPAPHSPNDLAGQLNQKLHEWTGKRWMISVSHDAQGVSMNQQKDAAAQAELDAARDDATVQQIMTQFAGAKIVKIEKIKE